MVNCNFAKVEIKVQFLSISMIIPIIWLTWYLKDTKESILLLLMFGVNDLSIFNNLEIDPYLFYIISILILNYLCHPGGLYYYEYLWIPSLKIISFILLINYIIIQLPYTIHIDYIIDYNPLNLEQLTITHSFIWLLLTTLTIITNVWIWTFIYLEYWFVITVLIFLTWLKCITFYYTTWI